MSDRSPFLVMCDMWGLDAALKKARQFGLNVTEKEVDEAKQREKKIADSLHDLARDFRRNNDEQTD